MRMGGGGKWFLYYQHCGQGWMTLLPWKSGSWAKQEKGLCPSLLLQAGGLPGELLLILVFSKAFPFLLLDQRWKEAFKKYFCLLLLSIRDRGYIRSLHHWEVCGPEHFPISREQPLYYIHGSMLPSREVLWWVAFYQELFPALPFLVNRCLSFFRCLQQPSLICLCIFSQGSSCLTSLQVNAKCGWWCNLAPFIHLPLASLGEMISYSTAKGKTVWTLRKSPAFRKGSGVKDLALVLNYMLWIIEARGKANHLDRNKKAMKETIGPWLSWAANSTNSGTIHYSLIIMYDGDILIISRPFFSGYSKTYKQNYHSISPKSNLF